MNFLDIVFYITYFFVLFYSVYLLLSLITKIFVKEEKKESKSLTATIVIPAYNEEENISKTILSALKLDYPKKKLKIVIVNDGSTDDTLKIARKFEKKYSNVKVINQKNIGKGASLNKVLKHTNTDLFIVFDSDSRIEKSALKKIVPYFEEKDVAAVSPFMIVEKPKNLLQKIQYIEYLIFSFLRKIHSITDIVNVIPGPFSVYKTKILKEIKGFDENSIVEDQEVAWRLQKKGYRILHETNAKVYTVTPDNIRKLVNQRKRWYKGSLETIDKHKDAIFNIKLGNFGLFQTPALFFSNFILPILGLILLFNMIVISTIKKVYRLYYEGLHFEFNIKDFITQIQTFWLTIDFSKVALLSLLLIITLYWVFTSFFYSDKKFNKNNIIPLITYIFFYYMIMTYVLLISLYEFFKNKIFKERKKVWYK